MSSTLTLTAVSSVDLTQHVCPCAILQSACLLTCVLQLQCTFSMGIWQRRRSRCGQHRLIRSAPSRTTDVAVAQNDLHVPPSSATGPGPVAHPASRSWFDDFPFTVGDRGDHTYCRDENTTHDSRRATAGPSAGYAQARHT